MIQNAQIVGHDVSPAQYETETEQRGSPALVVRAHILCEILRNAQRWVKGYQSPDSKSKKFGSLLDCLLLTPFQYPKRYCSTPPTYTNKKGELSKWRNDMRIAEVAAWHEEHEGLEVVDADTNASVHGAIKRIREDAMVSGLIDTSKHAVMVVAEWHQDGLVVPLKCLIDIVPRGDDPVFSNGLWDLKSTQNAAPRQFMKDAQRYGYAIQAGFYLDMWNAASHEQRGDFGHVVIESYPPYEFRTPPPLLSQRFLNHGKLLYQRALAIYCRGLSEGIWPGYDHGGGEWPITDCEDFYLSMNTLFDDMEEPEEEEEPTETEPADLIP